MPVINLLNACTLSLSLPIKLMPCRRIQKKTLVIVCEQNWIHIHSIVTTKKFGNLERGGGCSQSSKTSNNMHMKRQEMMKRWYEMEWSTIIGQEMSASIGQRSLSLLSLSYENYYACITTIISREGVLVQNCTTQLKTEAKWPETGEKHWIIMTRREHC